uniref:Uncharacterized protein n=1 Tax=Tanacetum cinerariifolium TaxID=118510 RepID=A0A6L2MID0_TANCI|nr:hypothetical protein [Tanacetum cinerariifolium]
MIKEHDQQAKMKAAPRKLAYADSDKEALAGSLAKDFSDRFFLNPLAHLILTSKLALPSKVKRPPPRIKKLAKKLRDKIPKTVDKMFERVRAFIRGEVVVGSAEMVCPSQGDKGYVRSAWTGVLERARNRGGPMEARRNIGVYTPYPRKDTFTPLTKTLKEILTMKPPPLIKTPKKQT